MTINSECSSYNPEMQEQPNNEISCF